MMRAANDDLPVLIPHVDDLGVSHGANVAMVELARPDRDSARARARRHPPRHPYGCHRSARVRGHLRLLGREYRLPVLLNRDSASYDSVLAMGPLDREFYDGLIAELDAERMPLVDRFAMGLALRHLSCEQAYRQIEHAGPGLTFVSLHCNAPGDIEAMHPNDAAWRIAEYELFQEPDFLAWIAAQDVRLGAFREIRDRYREGLAKA